MSMSACYHGMKLSSIYIENDYSLNYQDETGECCFTMWFASDEVSCQVALATPRHNDFSVRIDRHTKLSGEDALCFLRDRISGLSKWEESLNV